MKTDVKFGPTLDDRLEFLKTRDKWVEFLEKELDGYGDKWRCVDNRIVEYLKPENRTKHDTATAAKINLFILEVHDDLSIAVTRKSQPWFGYKDEPTYENGKIKNLVERLGMKKDYFIDRAQEAFRDFTVYYENFHERRITWKKGAGIGLTIGISVAALPILLGSYELITNPEYNDSIQYMKQNPLESIKRIAALSSPLVIPVTLWGTAYGLFYQVKRKINKKKDQKKDYDVTGTLEWIIPEKLQDGTHYNNLEIETGKHEGGGISFFGHLDRDVLTPGKKVRIIGTYENGKLSQTLISNNYATSSRPITERAVTKIKDEVDGSVGIKRIDYLFNRA